MRRIKFIVRNESVREVPQLDWDGKNLRGFGIQVVWDCKLLKMNPATTLLTEDNFLATLRFLEKSDWHFVLEAGYKFEDGDIVRERS